MGLKVGYFVGFLHPPEENLPIQNSYIDAIGLLTNTKTCKRNRPKSWLFGWSLAPSCDDHEFAYACVSLPFESGSKTGL